MKSSIRPSTLDKNAFDRERKSDGWTASRLDDPLGSPSASGGEMKLLSVKGRLVLL